MSRRMAGLCVGLTALLAGCASSATHVCTDSFSLGASAVNPATGLLQATGSADHTQPSPGNQAKFLAGLNPTASAGCPIPQYSADVYAQWTLSDNVDASISSAADATNGVATCTGTTLTPATVTGTYTQSGTTKSASTTLTCK